MLGNEKSLDKILGFSLKCGFFSYAETPKYYKRILGVTGTL
jgi:hypothetical protein